MKIVDVIASPGLTGFYFDDQQAIKCGATHDGFTYNGEPQTPGFKAVRQRGESISVLLILEDGQVASGDCAAVQYSGAGGRDPLFLAEDFIPIIMEEIAPKLVGQELDSFRHLVGLVENSKRWLLLCICGLKDRWMPEVSGARLNNSSFCAMH